MEKAASRFTKAFWELSISCCCCFFQLIHSIYQQAPSVGEGYAHYANKFCFINCLELLV